MISFHLIIFTLLINWKCITSLPSELLRRYFDTEDSISEHSFSGPLEDKFESWRKGKSFGSHEADASEVFDVTIVKQLGCPHAYTEVDGLCLHYRDCYDTDDFTYEAATIYCKTVDMGGGNLVVFKDADEYRSIVKFIMHKDPDYDCSYWLGARQTSSSSSYQFIDGTYVPRTGPFWVVGEPDLSLSAVVFDNTESYRLSSYDSTDDAGMICQYKPGNITLSKLIHQRSPPNLIPIPYPAFVTEKDDESNVNNLDITLPASNFSSDQNANFQNAPVINIETHSHYIDSSPEIVPIPPYLPLPKLPARNGTIYHNPHGQYNNYHHQPRPYHNHHPAEGYFPIAVRGHAPINTNVPQAYINSGQVPGITKNFYNQGFANLVSRDDKNKTEMNKTVAKKIIKESTISPNLKTNRGSLSDIQTEMDNFKQRSRETAQLSKEKDSENAMAQLTSLLDKIDVKYGKPKGQINTEFASHSKRTISKEEEAARLIKIMNELQALIAKVELLDTNQPNQSVKGLKHKKPIIGNRRMHGSRLLVF